MKKIIDDLRPFAYLFRLLMGKMVRGRVVSSTIQLIGQNTKDPHIFEVMGPTTAS